MLQIKFKKLDPNAKIPTRSRPTDAGIDLYALEERTLICHETAKVRTGIAAEIPPGYCGVLKTRSGMAANCVSVGGGVIDEEYRGDITVILHNLNDDEYFPINPGDKIAQMLIVKREDIEIIDVGDESLSATDRGDKGFGSSGR